jgi:predicted nucleotidyltransferase
LGKQLEADRLGVKALYLVGSTKSGTAGPGSDIDLIVHFKGNETQRDQLMEWFEDEGKKLAEENEQKTGIQMDNILDVHLITDEDIDKKTSWATHITSQYMSARSIPLKQELSD